MLNGGCDDHVSLAEKLAANAKVAAKSLQNVTKELAVKDATEANGQTQRYFVRHKRDCDVTYTNVLLSEITNKVSLTFRIRCT